MRFHYRLTFLAAALCACATSGQPGAEMGQSLGAPPATDKRPVTDVYHGVSVTEDYRWLEDWNDPTVQEWSKLQNVHARKFLDATPNVDALRTRVSQVLSAKTVTWWALSHAGGNLFAKKRQPPKQQPFLVVMPSWDTPEKERILVDPNTLDAEHSTSIDWYVPSHDGKLVAVSMSKGGTESGDVHVFDVATGKEVFEVVPRANSGTAGGSLAWAPDNKGFYYTRHPRPGERPDKDLGFFQQVYFHTLGTASDKDRYELGKDFPRIAEIQFDLDKASGQLLATVQKGDGGEFAHYLRSADGEWRKFSSFGDRILQAAFGPDNDFYVISRAGAPRGKIIRISRADLDVNKAELIIPEGEDTIVEDFWGPATVLPTAGRLYVVYQLGGPSEIRVFDHKGKRLDGPKQLPVAAVYGIMPIGGDDILFGSRSYVVPPAYYRYTVEGNTTAKTALATESPVDMSKVKVVREFATSKDGTKVPVNILMKEGTKLDGSNPCVVYGYGGYGVNLVPRFGGTTSILLDQGVVYAVANLRGGGEYGEQWHRQGNLTNKQNVFDDFAAAVGHMQSRGYTTPERTAIMGGSNGGLLMGATMTQWPKSVKVVVSYVGIYDMLRVELSSNGAFNVTEFGTVKNEDHFKALHAYSPYHQVKTDVAYPATLFLTGANDPRVDPMQSRKMTARLQSATSAAAPILLRTSMNTGHGGGTPLEERINQTVDAYGFLLNHLAVQYQALPASN